MLNQRFSEHFSLRGRLIGAKRPDSSKRPRLLLSGTSHPGQEGPTPPSGADSSQFPADIEEFLAPLLADGVGIEVAQFVKVPCDGIARGRDHALRIAVGAAGRLPQDA